MPVILFQGDSITDGGRSRADVAANSSAALGMGYPLLIASRTMRAHPDVALRFFNRGVSGDKVPDLQARWQVDTIALKPDILSLLVGVNDFWHKLLSGYAGTVADYETQLTGLLDGTKAALPSVHLVLLEPFVLRTGSVDAKWFPEFDDRRAAAARAAQHAGATFIPLQAMFDGLSRNAPPEYWAADGVHPTIAGHAAIADMWRETLGL